MLIGYGKINKTIPNTSVKRVKFDPIAVPKPNFKWFSFKALSDVDNSGSDAPTAIIVAAITDLAMPSIDAMFDADLTTKLELIKMRIKPIMNSVNVL